MSAKTTPWRKSSRSGGNGGQCVETRQYDQATQVRDSKDPSGPVLAFDPSAWRAFLSQVHKGAFDR
jgi:Domain of unknown function (DUF397)